MQALVTGAASGIGQACARALAATGAHVHVVDKNEAGATTLATEINGEPHALDLANPEAINTLPANIDILINNAGLQHIAPIHEFPPDQFTRLQQVMVTAPFLLMRRTSPHMYAKNWGRIINISSVHGLRASPFKSAYTAAKHGLEGLSKVAALEGAQHGVTSNCVNPGYVRTPLVDNQVTAQAKAYNITEEEVLTKVFLQRSAVKRLIEPEEVAAMVLWLCGEAASFVTGASLALDGGWTAQ